MRSTDVQRKLTCSASRLEMVPITSSSPAVGPAGKGFGFLNRTLWGTASSCPGGTDEGAQGRLCRPGTVS